MERISSSVHHGLGTNKFFLAYFPRSTDGEIDHLTDEVRGKDIFP